MIFIVAKKFKKLDGCFPIIRKMLLYYIKLIIFHKRVHTVTEEY